MNLSNISNPFKSHAAPARNSSLQGMPLHQRQHELKTAVNDAKTEVGKHNPNALKTKSNGETQVINNLSHRKIADPVAYNRTCIRYEQANHDLNMFNKTNADGLKAEAKAGPQPLQPNLNHNHPTSLIPGHPDSAPQRQAFHPELFMPAPPQGHNHPSSLIPGHPNSAPQRTALSPDLTFQAPAPQAGTPAANTGRPMQRTLPAGPRPMPTDNSAAARLEQARYELRVGGNRVPEPGLE